MGEIRVKTADGWQTLPAHQKTSTGWKDIPTHTMTANGWQGELTSQSPLEFRATGQSLLDWRLDGKTSGNLFDENMKQSSVRESSTRGATYETVTSLQSSNRITSINPQPANGNTISWDDSVFDIFICYFNIVDGATWYTGDFVSWGASSPHVCKNYPLMSVTIREKNNSVITPSEVKNAKLMLANTALPYEPYGGVGDWDETEQQYKIPITVNGVTANLYTTSQLMDGDSLDFATDQTTIPITQGDNTLTVGTAVQPKSVYVKFEG